MTRSVAQCVWLAAQQPAMDGEALGLCRLCGAAGMGLPFERWVKDTHGKDRMFVLLPDGTAREAVDDDDGYEVLTPINIVLVLRAILKDT